MSMTLPGGIEFRLMSEQEDTRSGDQSGMGNAAANGASGEAPIFAEEPEERTRMACRPMET